MNNSLQALLVVFVILLLTACEDANQPGLSSNPTTGTAGSMSRFSVVDNMLYAIAGDSLQLVNVEQADDPHLWNLVRVGFGIETLFAYQQYLFIGSQTGVLIYDNSMPEFPQFLTNFTHALSCDPVVVQEAYAYVTLRGNSRCWGSSNQLDIINVSDISNPVLEKSYAMQEPYGLGISDNLLFVCDGRAGLKAFDVSEKTAIKLIDYLPDVNCYDVIPNNNILLVSADSGIQQYAFNENKLVKLSEIYTNTK